MESRDIERVLRDTLLDMANYCVMMIVAMDGGVFKGDSDE